MVEVKVTEGPMAFAHHAVGFTAYGTVVRLRAGEHRHVGARMILPLDDPVARLRRHRPAGRRDPLDLTERQIHSVPMPPDAPLHGIRILECSALGPAAITMPLVDLGAEVDQGRAPRR